MPWCKATNVVDPGNVGRDFYARRESYNFTNRELLSVIGERMIEAVRRLTGNESYSEKDLKADLNDLKQIIKLRSAATPVPRQPRTWKAKLYLDGYPQEYTVFYPATDDPRAVELLEKLELDGAKYRLKNVEGDIARRVAEITKLEAEAAKLRELLGVLV
jgi:hypothetical protein